MELEGDLADLISKVRVMSRSKRWDAVGSFLDFWTLTIVIAGGDFEVFRKFCEGTAWLLYLDLPLY